MGILIWIIIVIVIVNNAKKKQRQAKNYNAYQTRTPQQNYQRNVSQQNYQRNVSQQNYQRNVSQQNYQRNTSQQQYQQMTLNMTQMQDTMTAKQQELKSRLQQKYPAQPMQQARPAQRPTAKGDILSRSTANTSGHGVNELKNREAEKTLNCVGEIHNSMCVADNPEESCLMKELNDLMLMGYQANLSFERDFLAEGIDMLNSYEISGI